MYGKKRHLHEVLFADLFNCIVGRGKELFTTGGIREINGAAEIVVKDSKGKELGVHRYRDIIMEAQSGETLILLAVENQEEIHYAMPVRSMLYDAMNYAEQVSNIAKRNRASKILEGSAEYLSGFRRGDRLCPIITLVFYYGNQEWDGSKDIYGMFNLEMLDLKYIEKYIPNYHINLIQAKDLVENNSFKTDLQWIIGMLKYKEDKTALIQYVNEHENFFGNLDSNEFGAAKALLGGRNIPETVSKMKGGISMCKALDDWYQDGVNEGIKRGEDRFRRLCLSLSDSGKKADLERALRDEEYCRELYQQYQL